LVQFNIKFDIVDKKLKFLMIFIF